MPLKAEFYQSRGKIARGVTNPVLAAEAQLQRTFAAAKVEIKRFFNWGIGYFLLHQLHPITLLGKQKGSVRIGAISLVFILHFCCNQKSQGYIRMET